jgi:hypothetical protein
MWRNGAPPIGIHRTNKNFAALVFNDLERFAGKILGRAVILSNRDEGCAASRIREAAFF